MKGKMLLALVSISFAPFIHGMREDSDRSKELTVYAIPGQNGQGCETYYVETTLDLPEDSVVRVETPNGMKADFGQRFCMKRLREVISTSGRHGIIYAASQGTATALNYLVEDQGKNISGLILESVLVSGNSAIKHTIGGPLMNLKFLVNMPLSYYWLPYVAKALFPFYWPAGKQAIKSLAKIPTNIPIVIVHSKKDPQLSYDDACALYYGLRLHGNENVYFISQNGSGHLRLIRDEQQKVIRAILGKHKLVGCASGLAEVDLNIYQPDCEQFKELYENICCKEKRHEYLGAAFLFGSLCVATKICMKYFKR